MHTTLPESTVIKNAGRPSNNTCTPARLVASGARTFNPISIRCPGTKPGRPSETISPGATGPGCRLNAFRTCDKFTAGGEVGGVKTARYAWVEITGRPNGPLNSCVCAPWPTSPAITNDPPAATAATDGVAPA